MVSSIACSLVDQELSARGFVPRRADQILFCAGIGNSETWQGAQPVVIESTMRLRLCRADMPPHRAGSVRAGDHEATNASRAHPIRATPQQHAMTCGEAM